MVGAPLVISMAIELMFRAEEESDTVEGESRLRPTSAGRAYRDGTGRATGHSPGPKVGKARIEPRLDGSQVHVLDTEEISVESQVHGHDNRGQSDDHGGVGAAQRALAVGSDGIRPRCHRSCAVGRIVVG